MSRLALVVPILLVLSACAAEGAGSADLALIGQAPSGRVYRLREAIIRVQGDAIDSTFHTEDDPDRASIITRLPAGDYQLSLAAGWQLERVTTSGATEIEAELISPNPLAFSVADGEVSFVRLRFAVDGEDVALSGGDVDIGVDVEERDARTPDAGVDPDAGADAAPADAGADATIPDAGIDGGVPSGVVIHVSPQGTDASPGTSPDRPVLHVQTAIDRAALCVPTPCQVHVAQGTYAENFQLRSGVSVLGGYRADFGARDGRLYPVIFTTGGSRAVSASGLGAFTQLEDVIVRGADLVGDTAGTPSIALYVANSGAWLTLRRVRVELGRGGRGDDGDDGVVTACQSNGGVGGQGFSCGASAGTPGGVGESGGAAAGGAAGESSCNATTCTILFPTVGSGRTGTAGGNGGIGASGVPTSERVGTFVAGAWVGPLGTPGVRGGHGGGGGGGGAGGAVDNTPCGCGILPGGRGGDGGSGGCGGGGGASGGAGGAALGIVIIGSSVIGDVVDLVGGTGGVGGPGGDGAPGGDPGPSNGGRQTGAQSTCTFALSGNGGIGGAGGRGGLGGGGPGGVGGPVIGTALVSGGLLLGQPGSVTFALGAPGSGGPGGLGPVIAAGGNPGVAVNSVAY